MVTYGIVTHNHTTEPKSQIGPQAKLQASLWALKIDAVVRYPLPFPEKATPKHELKTLREFFLNFYNDSLYGIFQNSYCVLIQGRIYDYCRVLENQQLSLLKKGKTTKDFNHKSLKNIQLYGQTNWCYRVFLDIWNPNLASVLAQCKEVCSPTAGDTRYLWPSLLTQRLVAGPFPRCMCSSQN